MSDWLLDLGNTRLKLAPLQAAGTRGAVVALEHGNDGFADALLHAMPASDGVAYLASVAGSALTRHVEDVLARRCARIARVAVVRERAGVRIAYAEPERMGVDRFLALLAAHALRPGACLVVGVGTALTIDLLDAEGHHRGGRIAPSPTLMRESLHRRAAQLPASGGRAVAFAHDTADALASGCEGAARALVADSLQQAHALLGAVPGLLLHGGGAGTMLASLPQAAHVPELVLDGLALWARDEPRA